MVYIIFVEENTHIYAKIKTVTTRRKYIEEKLKTISTRRNSSLLFKKPYAYMVTVYTKNHLFMVTVESSPYA